MTYFPLHQTTCFFIPLVAPCKPLLPFIMKLRLHRYVNKVPAREEIKQVFLRDIKAMPYVKVLEVLLIAPPHNRRMTVTEICLAVNTSSG